MNLIPVPIGRSHLAQAIALVFSLMALGQALAQPTVVSFTPQNGARNLPLSTSVVITFSEPMNTSETDARMFNPITSLLLPTSLAWNGAHTVLTCSPTVALPAGQEIDWAVTKAQNPAGTPMWPLPGGIFFTAAPLQLTLTNTTWTVGICAFDVTSPSGQTLTVEYSSTLRSNQWQTLVTTNSATGRVHIVDPHSSTNRYLFYRARTGS